MKAKDRNPYRTDIPLPAYGTFETNFPAKNTKLYARHSCV